MPWWEWVCRLAVIAAAGIEVIGRHGQFLWLGVAIMLLATVVYFAMLKRTGRYGVKKWGKKAE